jgi:hypothetical protein
MSELFNKSSTVSKNYFYLMSDDWKDLNRSICDCKNPMTFSNSLLSSVIGVRFISTPYFNAL